MVSITSNQHHHSEQQLRWEICSNNETEPCFSQREEHLFINTWLISHYLIETAQAIARGVPGMANAQLTVGGPGLIYWDHGMEYTRCSNLSRYNHKGDKWKIANSNHGWQYCLQLDYWGQIGTCPLQRAAVCFSFWKHQKVLHAGDTLMDLHQDCSPFYKWAFYSFWANLHKSYPLPTLSQKPEEQLTHIAECVEGGWNRKMVCATSELRWRILFLRSKILGW